MARAAEPDPGLLRLSFALLLITLLAWLCTASAVRAQQAPADDTAEALDRFQRAAVTVTATVPADARTARYLGRTRSGNGIVIDEAGLVLTIGYLVLEASSVIVTDSAGRELPADVVAYDFDSGFGLVRALGRLEATPIDLGRSSDLEAGAPLVALGHQASGGMLPVLLVDRREFAGYWEYLLDDALFTAPRHPGFGGAGLLDDQGRLVGIGSLQVPNADGDDLPGNMFVPIDLLKPILGDLLTHGRSQADRRPWLGMTSVPLGPGLLVRRVTDGGPADLAGVRPGDVVVGVEGERFRGMAGFLRQLWSSRLPGDAVSLELFRGRNRQSLTVTTGDRYDFLKLDHTF